MIKPHKKLFYTQQWLEKVGEWILFTRIFIAHSFFFHRMKSVIQQILRRREYTFLYLCVQKLVILCVNIYSHNADVLNQNSRFWHLYGNCSRLKSILRLTSFHSKRNRNWDVEYSWVTRWIIGYCQSFTLDIWTIWIFVWIVDILKWQHFCKYYN